MRTPLAWRNLLHNRMRSLTALGGVSFAILLIFMQLGFHDAASTSATKVYELLDFDLMLVSPQYAFIAKAGTVPRSRLAQLRGFEGVERVTPFWLGWGEWRNPATGYAWSMLVLGADPDDHPFRDDEIDRQLPRLAIPDDALIDRVTRPEYGPTTVGVASELDRHRLRIVGHYSIGVGFVAGSSMLVGEGSFRRLFPGLRADHLSVGLVKLAAGIDREAMAARMNARLAPQAQVITRAALMARERDYWLKVRPVGIMFTTGVLVAFLIGSVILYQLLASEVQNRLREYATLKALGYGDAQVYGIVLQQGLIFAALGFLPALLGAHIIYALLRTQAMVPVEMEAGRIAAVLALTATMCIGATLAAVRRLRNADPAELF